MKQQKLSDGDHQAMPLVIFCAVRIHTLNDTQHFTEMHTKLVLAAGVEIDNHRENNPLLLDGPLQ